MTDERLFRLQLTGFLLMLVLYIVVENLELRWRLRGIYDELDQLRLVQSRCRFLVVETAGKTAEAPLSERDARSQPEDDPIVVSWPAPQREREESSEGAA